MVYSTNKSTCTTDNTKVTRAIVCANIRTHTHAHTVDYRGWLWLKVCKPIPEFPINSTGTSNMPRHTKPKNKLNRRNSNASTAMVSTRQPANHISFMHLNWFHSHGRAAKSCWGEAWQEEWDMHEEKKNVKSEMKNKSLEMQSHLNIINKE